MADNMEIIKNLNEAKDLGILFGVGGCAIRQNKLDEMHPPTYGGFGFVLKGNFEFYDGCCCVSHKKRGILIPGMDNLHVDAHVDSLKRVTDKLNDQVLTETLPSIDNSEESAYVLLTSAWANHNIYHFFADVVGRLAFLSRFVPLENLIYLIPNKSAPFYREFFDILNFKTLTYDVEKKYVGEIYIPSLINASGRMPYETINFLKKSFSKYETLVSKNYYISRSKTTRSVENESDLVYFLRKHIDIEVINMEDLTLRQQISLMASAKNIIGPHGAGMACSIFQRTGALFEFFSPFYIHKCFENIHTQTNITYISYAENADVQHNVQGENFMNSYVVDLDKFEAYFLMHVLPKLKK